MVIFFDDILIMSESKAEVTEHFQLSASLLQSFDSLINCKKSLSLPCQSVEFLGMVIDSSSLTLSLPKRELDDISNLCKKVLRKDRVT